MQNLRVNRCLNIIRAPYSRIEDLIYVVETGLSLTGKKVHINHPDSIFIPEDPFEEYRRQISLLIEMYNKAAVFIENYARENNIK